MVSFLIWIFFNLIYFFYYLYFYIIISIHTGCRVWVYALFEYAWYYINRWW